MDTTLLYLRESLSNHLNRQKGVSIYKKLQEKKYQSEEDFVRNLEDDEITFLNTILKKEIRYAEDEQDEERAHQLNEVYELLF